MYLLALLKPVPMYKVRDRGSQSIQSREYVEEVMDMERDDQKQERYTDFEEILPVWLEYKGSVPGHEEFIHVNWVTKIDGEAWRISVALRAHQYRNLIIRQYERRPIRGAMVVENVFYKCGDELYEIGRPHAIKWGRGTNDSVNELTLYWEEEG